MPDLIRTHLRTFYQIFDGSTTASNTRLEIATGNETIIYENIPCNYEKHDVH